MSLKSSILKRAMNIVFTTTIQYRKYSSKTVNTFGVSSLTYTTPTSIRATVEPGIVSSFGGKCIELKDYKDMGLDWSRRYVTIWIPYAGMEPDANRDGADQFYYNGKVWNVLQVEDWGDQNDWQRCYCVEEKNATWPTNL